MESPFGWPGGKRNLKNTLLKALPPHRAYVEVFAGSAKLLFAKEPSQWEIVNDLNDDLVNFFRVVKHRPSELAELLEHDLIASGRFAELRKAPRHESEIERAVQFAYLTWYSFGCKGEHFASIQIKHIDKARAPVKKSLARVRILLADVADRLRRVLVESRDFAECIGRYDSMNTFFYCDPPYFKFQDNGRYTPLGDRNEELFALLGKIKGKFLLSFDGAPEIRELAARHRFHCREVSTSYSLSGGGPRPVRELLISNYRPNVKNIAQSKD
jgi:DNA adenine methylase